MLYPSNPETLALQFVKSKESVTISIFTKKLDIPVSPAGVFVDTEQGFLAASPDGDFLKMIIYRKLHLSLQVLLAMMD